MSVLPVSLESKPGIPTLPLDVLIQEKAQVMSIYLADPKKIPLLVRPENPYVVNKLLDLALVNDRLTPDLITEGFQLAAKQGGLVPKFIGLNFRDYSDLSRYAIPKEINGVMHYPLEVCTSAAYLREGFAGQFEGVDVFWDGRIQPGFCLLACKETSENVWVLRAVGIEPCRNRGDWELADHQVQ